MLMERIVCMEVGFPCRGDNVHTVCVEIGVTEGEENVSGGISRCRAMSHDARQTYSSAPV